MLQLLIVSNETLEAPAHICCVVLGEENLILHPEQVSNRLNTKVFLFYFEIAWDAAISRVDQRVKTKIDIAKGFIFAQSSQKVLVFLGSEIIPTDVKILKSPIKFDYFLQTLHTFLRQIAFNER